MAESTHGNGGIHVSVCMGTNCTFRGAAQLVETMLADEKIKDYCTIVETSCLSKKCNHANNSPVIRIEDDYFTQAKPEAVLDELHARIIAAQAETRET
ncbi:MAG: (2Fe-2S) ferredoxin domain-containing protein [Spirochaetaceae bacterium]|nr:(2Fe-2S) ferredoxin domain-containing protein [Spirochaetaceae bacterium]